MGGEGGGTLLNFLHQKSISFPINSNMVQLGTRILHCDIMINLDKSSMKGCSSDIASSYIFRSSKVTEYVTSRVSGGEFRTK